MLRVRLSRKRLYIIAGVLIGINFLILGALLLRRNVPQIAKENTASISGANNLIANFDTPSEKFIGRDAGLAGYIYEVGKEAEELKAIGLKLPQPLACLSAISACNKLKDFNNASNELLTKNIRELERYAETLSHARKFLEYNPRSDLSNYDPNDADERERLTRTKEGITEMSKTLYAQNYPTAIFLSAEADKLIAAIAKVQTNEDVELWAKAVEVSQNTMLKSLIEEAKRIRANSEELRLLVESYQ